MAIKLKYRPLLIASVLVQFLLNGFDAMAQPAPLRPKIRYISTSGVVSKIEVHSRYVKNLNNTYPYAIEVDAGIHNYSPRAIELYGCNIRFGGTATYWQFNHPVLGRALSAMLYAEPFLLSFNKLMVSIKAGAGAMYLTHPYNEISNPQNLAYSTKIAFPLSAGFSVYFPVNYHWAVKLNSGFYHFSNGGIKKPNYGINQTTVALGLEYTPDIYKVPPRSFQQNLTLNPKVQRNFIETAYAFCIKDDGANDAAKLLHVGLLAYHHRLTRINGFGAATLFEYYHYPENANLSVMGGHKFYLGRFGFSQNIGVYLFKGEEQRHSLMQYYAMDYALFKKLNFGVNLKAHAQTASWLGVKVGYTF